MSLIIMASLFLTGCSAPVVKGTLFEGAKPPGAEARSLALKPGEAIVVLSAESITKDEAWPASCVRDVIESADSNIRSMTPQVFRDATFPWFESHQLGEGLAELSMPSLRGAAEQIGVRYIVSVGGQTAASEPDGWGLGGQGGGLYVGKRGFMMCGAGPGGGGCLGFLAWQRTSDLSATVSDLKRGILVGAIAAKVTGTNLMPAVGLPVPLIATTETAACRELGYQIARFVTTGEMPEISEADIVADESNAQK
jgi:hypothetical protein